MLISLTSDIDTAPELPLPSPELQPGLDRLLTDGEGGFLNSNVQSPTATAHNTEAPGEVHITCASSWIQHAGLAPGLKKAQEGENDAAKEQHSSTILRPPQQRRFRMTGVLDPAPINSVIKCDYCRKDRTKVGQPSHRIHCDFPRRHLTDPS